MPVGSTVAITYDGTDVTNRVLWSSARFEFQQNGTPGTFDITVKDVDHTNLFITGKILELEIDGTLMFCGFGLAIDRAYPFSAMDTTDPDTVARYWRIQGADLNRLFDKRVLRNPAAYTTQIPNFTGADYDGDLIKLMCSDYLDLDVPSGLDTTTFVDNIMRGQDRGFSSTSKMAWNQQGDTMRQQIEAFTQFTGALYYWSADRALHHHAIDSAIMRWGFSDKPNHGSITASPVEYQGSTIGPREIVATEDGSQLVNDAFVWGGSSWTQGVVFARETDSTSITDHGLWQLAEVHVGESGGFGIQEGVDTRADLIVNGSPGAVGADQNRGLRYPQWSFRFAWFAHDVPTISGVRDHVKPGYLSTITLEVYGDGVDPLVQLLPCRSMTITFPSLDEDGNGYVRFDGQFGLQPSDPFTLWNFLLRRQKQVASVQVAVVDDSSDSTVYGAIGHFTPSPAPDGATTVFTIPFGYIAGSSQFYLSVGGPSNGKLLFPGVDYTESDPIAGEFTLIGALAATPPDSPDEMLVTVRTLGA